MNRLTGRITVTGRFEEEPNMQNIPIRTEEGRQIRQAFTDWEDFAQSKENKEIN